MERTDRILMVLAGVISPLFSVFHILFFKLFNWAETLACLDHANWAIFQTFNLVSILMIVAITYFTFRHPQELIKTSLGKSLSVVFGLFYLIRVVAEFVFFGYSGGSIVILALRLVPAWIYLYTSVARIR
jgi:hypothetical protein